MADETPNIIPPVQTIKSEVVTTTQQTDNNPVTDSNLWGLSVRGLIVILLTLTLCYTVLVKIDVKEPFYSICVFAIGFYFGQKNLKST